RELAGIIKVNPYFVKEYLVAAKNYGLGKVIDNVGYLKEADLRSKGIGSNSIEESQILKELIFKLLHKSPCLQDEATFVFIVDVLCGEPVLCSVFRLSNQSG